VADVGALLRSWGRTAGPRAVAGWTAIYLAVVVSGQRFDARYLDYGWQLIPWDVLSRDPLASVWYLHVQPPGWNLLLGGAARLSPFSDALTIQALMFVVGVFGVALAARLAEHLGLGTRSAAIVAVVATANPEVLKGAFEPNYELAVGTMLLAVVLCVSRVLRSAEREVAARRLVQLSVVATVLVMTRSLYHPALLAVLFALPLWAVRRFFDRRSLLRVVAVVVGIPLVVVGGWMVKNQILFGSPTLSSWFGMNLQRAVIPVLDVEDLEAMHDSGAISEVAMVGPFGAYELYEPFVEPCTPRHSFRGLSEPARTTDETSPNFNFECYLPVFDQAGRDARAVILEHPGVWLEGRLWSMRNTIAVSMNPATSDSLGMRALDDVYSVVRLDYRGVLSTTGWGTPIYGSMEAPTDFSITVALMYLALGGLAVRALLPRRWRRWRTPRDVVVATAGAIAAFTVVVGAVAELGEQSRFRTAVDPLATVVVMSLMIPWIGNRLRRQHERQHERQLERQHERQLERQLERQRDQSQASAVGR